MVAEAPSGPRRRRIEIIHESLLTHWPRLVRWRAEEIGGAQLRDELRQAAQVWDQHGRSEDYLWSGMAFREFQLWRGRYPAGFTALEEDFAGAMTSAAARRGRRIRATVVSAIMLLLIVMLVIGLSWRRSELARRRAEVQTRVAETEKIRAENEARRAAAARLVSLGQLELDSYPTAALAYGIRSLEIADTREGRVLVMQALAEGSPAILTPYPEEVSFESFNATMSPDGKWLATGGMYRAQLFRQAGGKPAVVAEYPESASGMLVSFPTDRLLVTNSAGKLRAVSIPSGEEMWRAEVDGGPSNILLWRGGFVTATHVGDSEIIRSWSLATGIDRLIGRMLPSEGENRVIGDVKATSMADLHGDWLAFSDDGSSIAIRSLQEWHEPPRIVGNAESEIRSLTWHPSGERIATLHRNGDVRVWPVSSRGVTQAHVGLGEGMDRILFDRSGRWLATAGHPHAISTVRLLDTDRPDARPIILSGRHWGVLHSMSFSEDGKWLLTGHPGTVALWPMQPEFPVVFDQHRDMVFGVAFTPDSETVISASSDGTVRAWPVNESASGSRILYDGPLNQPTVSVDPNGQFVAVAGTGSVDVLPLADGTANRLPGPPSAWLTAVAVSPDGQHVASGPLTSTRNDKEIRIWNLESDRFRSVRIGDEAGDGFAGGVMDLHFLPDGRLLFSTIAESCVRISLFDPGTGRSERVSNAAAGWSFAVHQESSLVAHPVCREKPGLNNINHGALGITDLRTSETRMIPSHGTAVQTVALDPGGGIIVTGSADGIVRVGLLSGEEPYLLLGHEGDIVSVAVSPDARWIASAGADRTVRIWPVPDFFRPPLHTLPHDQLMAKLRTLTNLRVIDDEMSSTGYRLAIGPFPGWEEIPEW